MNGVPATKNTHSNQHAEACVGGALPPTRPRPRNRRSPPTSAGDDRPTLLMPTRFPTPQPAVSRTDSGKLPPSFKNTKCSLIGSDYYTQVSKLSPMLHGGSTSVFLHNQNSYAQPFTLGNARQALSRRRGAGARGRTTYGVWSDRHSLSYCCFLTNPLQPHLRIFSIYNTHVLGVKSC